MQIFGDERRNVLGCITGKLLGLKKQLDTEASVVSIKFSRIITKTDVEIRISRSDFQVCFHENHQLNLFYNPLAV